MSFNNLKKPQLVAVAQGFGVDVADDANVADLRSALKDSDYIEWDQAVALLKQEGLWDESDEKKEEARKEEAQAAAEARPKDTLIKMHRANRSYEILGYKFTQDNPYALTTSEDAEYITDSDPDGFRYATPKEAIDFYG
jgi:hypothetical protein